MIEQLVAIDTEIFIFLNTKLTHPVLDSVMPFITEQEHWYPVLGVLALAMIIWGGRRGRMAAVALLLAVGLADQVTCGILKPLVGRLRPCNALAAEQFRLLVGQSSAMSFPSAHAANSFAMATVISWRFPKASGLCLLVAAAVAYSRVYVGVHYPVDIIVGAVIGGLLGKLAVWIVETVRERIEVWREARAMAQTE